MSLWNLVGGMARGYGAEGKYLDERAKEVRQEALRQRQVLLEEQSKKEEMELRREQLAQQHEAMMTEKELHSQTILMNIERMKQEDKLEHERQANALRLEHLRGELDLKRQAQEFAFREKHPEWQGGRTKATEEFYSKLTPRERALVEAADDIYSKPLGQGETIEDRDALIARRKVFLEENIPAFRPPKVTGVTGAGQKLAQTFIDTQLKDVTDQNEAMKRLKETPEGRQVIAAEADNVVTDYISKNIPGKRSGFLTEFFPTPEERAAKDTQVRENWGNIGRYIGTRFKIQPQKPTPGSYVNTGGGKFDQLGVAPRISTALGFPDSVMHSVSSDTAWAGGRSQLPVDSLDWYRAVAPAQEFTRGYRQGAMTLPEIEVTAPRGRRIRQGSLSMPTEVRVRGRRKKIPPAGNYTYDSRTGKLTFAP